MASTVLRIVGAVLALLIVALGIRFTMLARSSETPPATLGATDGKLSPCPARPNCVSSQATRSDQVVAPLELDLEPRAALELAVAVVESMPGAKVSTAERGYLHAEFRSRLFRFVDDLELVFDPELPGFHVRSASRTGYSDTGVNAKRVEELRRRLAASAP